MRLATRSRAFKAPLRVEGHIPASQRLSHDILWYLFGFVLETDGDLGPTAVSHVSTLWRQAALESNFLWTRVAIRLVLSNQKHLAALARFERSGNWPLDLVIRASRGWREDEVERFILPYANRVRKLEVHTKGACRPFVWMGLTDVDFPILEEFDGLGGVESRIKLSRSRVRKADDGQEAEDDLEIPKNSSLVPFTTDVNGISWFEWEPYRLTSLTIVEMPQPPSIGLIHQILALSADTLVSFEYQGCQALNDTVPDPLALPALTSLKLAYYDDILPLIRPLELPNLQSLTLRNFVRCPTSVDYLRRRPDWEGSRDSDPVQLLACISQWSTITHLGLYEVELPHPAEILSYFRKLASLESLVLYGKDGPESVADGIFVETEVGAPTLLPKLKHLLCTTSDDRPLDLWTFLDNRRRHQLGKLDSMTLNEEFFIQLWRRYEMPMEFIQDTAQEIYSIEDPCDMKLPNLEETGMLANGRLQTLAEPRRRELV